LAGPRTAPILLKAFIHENNVVRVEA